MASFDLNDDGLKCAGPRLRLALEQTEVKVGLAARVDEVRRPDLPVQDRSHLALVRSDACWVGPSNY
ncbi:hypothetical protein [Micromonospora ureilytica]|uniref:hypothetical protein n=1 Tax=Micromonospora ureilytica TaxID=709868 RepID=UPI002E0F24D5|nr:hypothetical protein OHB55_08050 [Micromonospora ureilytica]